ncbi:hypothetical protein GCM10010196_21270 [Agromyces mediolanus]|uniref:IrrE N-terminal-like domain-containing protein n=2 Tax=Agromyces mediolanus TaxID=41986 RepID=A0A918CLB9_AGRME|nr:hypothetical protein GCM10010196_21270 [Agromyces mediolanus]GLJ71923.1 hypothetical protein GCM10017583_11790 [Agromyces mediolanus]
MTTRDTANRIRARLDAPAQVEAMLDEVRAISPDFLRDLRADPLLTLDQYPDVELSYLNPQDFYDQHCSIAGMYINTVTPPRLSVATATAERMRFTALHEFGHHLQQTTAIADTTVLRDDGGVALEEAACDLFAAKILLSDELVDSVLPTGTPSATDVARLWASADASRSAVAVTAAQRLTVDGYVAVIGSDGTVEFCATRGLPPLRRGSNQQTAEIVRALRVATQNTVERLTRFQFRDGIRGAELWAQAARAGNGYWFVVAAESGVPWKQLALPSFEAEVTGRWHVCEFCGHGWMNFSRAHDCGTPICPECTRCGCRNALKERLCSGCGFIQPAHLFNEGSSVCRDCAD